MECVITVRGGDDGRPRAVRTGTVRSFLSYNQVFYSRVAHHVFGGRVTPTIPRERPCLACDPEAILRTYLDGRAKKGGSVSAGLYALALSWEKRAAAQGRYIDPLLIGEFIWRRGPSSVVYHQGRLSSHQLFQAMRSHRFSFRDLTTPRLRAVFLASKRAPADATFADVDAALYAELGDEYVQEQDELDRRMGSGTAGASKFA